MSGTAELFNGGVYRLDDFRIMTLLYIGRDKFAMMSIGRSRQKGSSAPMFQFDKHGEFMFTLDELREHFGADRWVRLDGRLRLEKIDESTFVEYPIGELEAV